MQDKKRKADAREAANEYAPAPEGSWLTYGLIAIVLLSLALWIIGRFYDLNFLLHPIFVSSSVGVVFVGGVLLRKWRKRQHTVAYRSEYDRADKPGAP